MAVADLKKRMGLVMGLRALLMLLGGLYAVIWPAQALFVLIWAGAILLLVDGVLGLWALTFGGAKTGNFWFDIVRNVLAIVTGFLILISPILGALVTVWFVIYLLALQAILGALVTVWFVIYLLALQAILVGVMEIVVVLRERALYAKVWPVLVSGALYVLFGIVLLFAPLISAIFLTVFGGVLMILFAVPLLAIAWRSWRGGSEKTA